MSFYPDSPNSPDGPEGIDTENTTVPPYEGRRESADVDGPEESTKDDAKVGGATGPVVDDEMKAPEPSETEGGAVATPSDEQPASEMPETDLDDDMVGPSHTPGTGRAEDKS
ncbi:MAG: hypothetical protein ACR2JN_11305 [Lapillicoccus sp.]